MTGPAGFWCRWCGEFQPMRTARQMTAARGHFTECHVARHGSECGCHRKGWARFKVGDAAEFHDRITQSDHRVVIAEVLDDSKVYRTARLPVRGRPVQAPVQRYSVRFDGDDRLFVTDDSHLTEVK